VKFLCNYNIKDSMDALDGGQRKQSTLHVRSKATLTPLGIIASFLGVTEVFAVSVLPFVANQVQMILVLFVVIFPFIMASGFFTILWKRPENFYAPSEYGDKDPVAYINAIRAFPPAVTEQAKLVASIEQNPDDSSAQFRLLATVLDSLYLQYLILMNERNIDLADTGGRGPEYEVAYTTHSGGTGTLDMKAFAAKIHGAGLIEKIGNVFSITPFGREFADWITDKGMRAIFFSTDQGSWGEPNETVISMRRHREESGNTRRISSS